MAKIENPKNFNAGNKMMSNRVPSADKKIKTMDMDKPSTSGNNDTKKFKGGGLRNRGLEEAKREAKKQIIATAASVASDGAINKDAAKKVLDTKLGTAVVDSIKTPDERYRDNLNKKRQEREENGQSPNSLFVYFEALSLPAKILVTGSIASIFGIIIFISVFISLYNDQTMKTKQVVGHISSYLTESSAPNEMSDASSGEYGTGIFDDLFSKLKARFSLGTVNLYKNLGNLFSNKKCNGDACKQTAEYRYYQKVTDISYRYEKLYNIKLDWPLIIASNQIGVYDTNKSFEENLNNYNSQDVYNLAAVTSLDWEYDYQNIADYVYLASDDSRFDLQILAKNMVKKTSVQECVSSGKVIETKTVYDVLDVDLIDGKADYLKCSTGEYKVTNTYELDYEKYDEFLLEYLEKKHYGPSSGNKNNDGNDNPSTTIPGGTSLSNAMLNLARSELNAWNSSNATGQESLKNKYLDLFGLAHTNPWCASFASWVISNTSFEGKRLYPDVIKTRSASSQNFMLYFKNSSDSNIQFHYNTDCSKYSNRGSKYTPKQGDLIFFDNHETWDGDFADLNQKYIDHIGIVDRYQGNTVYTIEGNSSHSIKQRTYASSKCRIVGYGSWY